MSTSPDEKDLKEYLERRDEVSQRYQALGSEEPPPAVDRAILAKARAATTSASKAVPLRRRTATRWMVPFAVAATVVLSFAIFREAGVGTGVVPLESTEPMSTQVPLLMDAEERETAAAESDRRREEISQETLASLDAQAEQRVAATVPATQPVAVEPPAVEVPQAGIAQTHAIQPVTSQGPPPPAPPPAAPAMRAQQPAALAAEAVSAAAKMMTPESWLEDIRTLRAAGRNAEADAALEAFLDAYPDYFEQHPDVARP